MACLVNRAHATRTGQFDDLEGREQLSDPADGRRFETALPMVAFVQGIVDRRGTARKPVEVVLPGRRFTSPPPVVDVQNDQFGKQDVSLVR